MRINLMDIKETAEYLKMNKMTVYKLARGGKLPAFKVASEWRFKKEVIDEWLMGQLKGNQAFGKLKASQMHSAATKTVLIVDDEEVIRDFFTRTLTEYRVLTAASGEEALYIVKTEKPDLVLLDIRMPGIDGIETLRQIKNIDENTAVIMLSAHGTLKTSVQAARLGAHDSIAKPFDLEEMKSVIQGAITDKTYIKKAHHASKLNKKR
jgi:excisionase family DNA binding protein